MASSRYDKYINQHVWIPEQRNADVNYMALCMPEVLCFVIWRNCMNLSHLIFLKDANDHQ